MNDTTGYLRSNGRKAIKTGRQAEFMNFVKDCVVTATNKHEFLQ